MTWLQLAGPRQAVNVALLAEVQVEMSAGGTRWDLIGYAHRGARVLVASGFRSAADAETALAHLVANENKT